MRTLSLVALLAFAAIGSAQFATPQAAPPSGVRPPEIVVDATYKLTES